MFMCLAVTSVAPPALAGSGVDRRLKVLENSIHVWESAPANWNGLTQGARDRFLEGLQAALAGFSPSLESTTRPSTGDVAPERAQQIRTARELALRAASVYRTGMKSAQLESVSRRAKSLLSKDLARHPEAIGWALSEVVAWDSSQDSYRGASTSWRPSTKERRIMLTLLTDHRVRKLRGALMAIARRASDPLRDEALTRLARWSSEFGVDEVVDVFLVRLLGKAAEFRGGPHPVNVVLERISSSDHPLSGRAQEALRVRIAQLIVAADWRQCAIGIRLSRGMSLNNQIPVLLDGLSVWDRRQKSKREHTGLVRVRGDLTRELQRISGMKHGPEPRPWIDWWVEVRQGKRPMPGTPEFIAAAVERAKTPVSTAGFFGLRPRTDRVTFIIDHSASMAQNWGTTERSRYDEAIDQMLRFLQGADDGTEFNVILFDDVPIRSSFQLVDATPKNLESARKSLSGRAPGGSTHLRPAIELAMGIGEDGLPARTVRAGTPDASANGEHSFADTIIVLCDGDTAEGMGWVAPLLNRALPLYPVIFHTVHLGPTDDGALKELARLSGGDFLRVGN